MTTNSINSWAAERGLNFTAESLPSPPPFLDAGSPGPGICLTIREPEPTDQPPAQLGIWIPSSEETGSYCMMQEGDGEIETSHLPEFTNEAELTARMQALLSLFYHDFVFVPALESWLADKGLPYEIISPKEFCGDAAVQGDCTEWFFVEFKTQTPEEYDTILGVSGDGQAATFTADDDGFLDFDGMPFTCKSRSDLTNWLGREIISGK